MKRLTITAAAGEKNHRSILLSAIMRKVSGDFGKELAEAFADKDTEKVKKLMGEVTTSVVRSCKAQRG